MPEGPEVKRITNRLNKFFAGRELTAIDFYDESYRAKQVRNDVDDFVALILKVYHSFREVQPFTLCLRSF